MGQLISHQTDWALNRLVCRETDEKGLTMARLMIAKPLECMMSGPPSVVGSHQDVLFTTNPVEFGKQPSFIWHAFGIVYE